MSDLADLGLRIHSEEVDTADKRLGDLAGSAQRAERATDDLAGASKRNASATAAMLASIERAVTQMRDLQVGMAEGAMSAINEAKAIDKLGASMKGASGGAAQFNSHVQAYQNNLKGATKSSSAMTQATLNMTRQFADVGVTLASGMNPLMVLIQQGPQIADGLQVAGAAGLSFKAVMKGLLAQIAPFLVVLLPIIAAVAAVAAGFALFHRELSKDYPKNITDGLGLTEEQLERVKHKTVTFGDTVQATFNVIGRNIMQGPVGDALRWLERFFGDVLDTIVKGAIDWAARFVGVWTATFKTIVAHWRQFPQVMGAIVVGFANATISNLEAMVNTAIKGLNRLAELANKIPGVKVGTIDTVKFDRIKQANNPVATDFEKFRADAERGFRADVSRFGKAVGTEALKLAQAQALKEAGKAPKGAKGPKEPKGPAAPRDQTEERMAALAQAQAAAQAEQLQATLALTKDIHQRAVIEKQILAEQVAAKVAAVNKTIADIQDDKGLSQAKKDELIFAYRGVQAQMGLTGLLQQRFKDQETAVALVHQDAAIRQDELSRQVDILNSQAELAKFAYQRRAIAKEILKHDQAIQMLKLREALAVAEATNDQEAIAKARKDIAAAEVVIANQTKASALTLEQGFENVGGALGSMAAAFKSKDWSGALKNLIEAIGSAREAIAAGGPGKIGAIAGIASGVGGMVGGKAGGVISGAASGLMAASSLGALPGLAALGGPIGLAIGAAAGGLMALFDNSAKKAKKAAEAQAAEEAKQREMQSLADVSAQKRQLEIQLMELTGDAAGALATRRADELAGIDATNKALAQQVYDAQDAQLARDKLNSRREIEARILEASGDAIAAVTLRRQMEIDTAEKADQALLRQAQKVEEAAAARDAALDALTAAYDRESGSLQKAIDDANTLADTLHAFGEKLRGTADGLQGPTATRATAQSRFAANDNQVRSGSIEAAGAIQGLGEAFIEASKMSSTDERAYMRDIAAVRRSVDAAEGVARATAGTAELQLQQMKMQYDVAVGTLQAVQSFGGALAGFGSAVTNLAAATQQAMQAVQDAKAADAAPKTPAVVPPTREQAYLTAHPDVLANAQGRVAAGTAATVEDVAREHYVLFGQKAGYTFATGGGFTVGGSSRSGDKVPVNMWANSGEHVNVSREDNMARLAAAQERTNEILERQGETMNDVKKGVEKSARVLSNVTEGGTAMLTQDAA